MRRGEWSEARSALERAVALGASDPYTLIALGKIYRQQGEREAAVEMFHRARDGGAAGPDFQETLTRLERELDAEWDFAEMRSAHFQIAFAGGERRAMPRRTPSRDGLEDAYFHVGRKLDLHPERARAGRALPERGLSRRHPDAELDRRRLRRPHQAAVARRSKTATAP